MKILTKFPESFTFIDRIEVWLTLTLKIKYILLYYGPIEIKNYEWK